MSHKKLEGRGRLVPNRATGIAYQVHYGIHVVEDAVPRGKGMRQMRWAKCSIDLGDSGQVPDGNYFLYTDEGKVHQVRSVDGKWHYLAVAA
jgi:hypothetical protein